MKFKLEFGLIKINDENYTGMCMGLFKEAIISSMATLYVINH